jgi:hypothetical protein
MAISMIDYNGKQVRALDDDYRKQLEDGAAYLNKTTGSNYDAQSYDRKINADADARWGNGTTPAPSQTPTSAINAGDLSSTKGLLAPSNQPSVTSTPSASASAPVPAYQPAVATGYTATKQNVTAEQTAQGQLANITAQDSQLNQLAKTEAAKQANSRGLLNSSMAVGAAQRAVLQQATPIAQQDASTYATAEANNTQFSNAASQFNAGATNAASLANASASLQQQLAAIQSNTQMSIADKNNATNMAISNNDNNTKQLLAQLDNASKLGLAQLDADTKFSLANMDTQSKTALQTMINNNQQLLQTNVSASNIFTQYMTNLANISTSDKMDGPAKQQAADNQLAALNAQLQAIGQISGLDLSKYFKSASSATPGQPTDSQNQQP